MNRCVKMVKLLHEQLEHLNKNLKDIQTEMVLKSLQDVNNEMSSIIRILEPEILDDLLQICIGPE